MKSIGFNFTKNDFRFCVLNLNSTSLNLLEKNKIVYPNNMETKELMEWFETQISLIIDKHKPNKVSYKISLNLTTLEQIKRSCYPQAILNLISKKKNIEAFSFSSQGINATKFGEPKKSNVYDYVDSVLGKHPPYWDKTTKDAVLVAWFTLI